MPARRDPYSPERQTDPASAEPNFARVSAFTSSGEIRTLDDIERDVIVNALVHHRGSTAKAARALGIGRSTLYRRMMQLGVRQPL